MLQVMEMLEEYFSSGDVAEVARSLAEQVPAVHARCMHEYCRKPASGIPQGACCI
jgi:hypothetical protein